MRGILQQACPILTENSSSRDLLPLDFVAFHDENRVFFLKYARFRGLSLQDAEDVINEAFLTLYRRRERLQESTNRKAFGFKVLRDAVVDHFRQSNGQPLPVGLSEDDLAQAIPPAQVNDEINDLVTRVALEQALEQLPQRQGDCMRLHALLDQDIRTVGQYLGINASTVTSHLHLGRERLSKLLLSDEDFLATKEAGA